MYCRLQPHASVLWRQVPFIVGARWFPDKKGLVTGAIITGMGASAFLFNILDTNMVNPLGLNTEGGLFPEAVMHHAMHYAMHYVIHYAMHYGMHYVILYVMHYVMH